MSVSERDAVFLDFARRNIRQIEMKARRFNRSPDEIRNILFVIFAEKFPKFDAQKGSLEALLFSQLHAVFLRYDNDVCSFAKSLDDPSKNGLAFRKTVELWISSQANEICFTNTNKNEKEVPGASVLRSLAESASGKSSSQISAKLRISRRRVNQILKKSREDSAFQLGLQFDEK